MTWSLERLFVLGVVVGFALTLEYVLICCRGLGAGV